MLRFRPLLLLTLLSLISTGSTCFGHFLFIRVGEHAEAGRRAEVFFSEYATAGDPRFFAKVSDTKLWLQAKSGEFTPLATRKSSDRLRAQLPSTGAFAVIGDCQYGILKREVPFLLQYYPKAVVGTAADINQFKPRVEIPLEIQSQIEGNQISFRLLHNGKAIPHAKLTTVDDDLVETELEADDAGIARWSPEESGYFCVYGRKYLDESGELDGEKYTQVRMFATLAFRWPVSERDHDPAASKLFQQALATRAKWKNFPGFTAELSGNINGRDFSGDVKVTATGEVTVDINDESVNESVEEQLSSIVMHRMSGERSADNAPQLSFADQDTSHPLGRLLTFHGGAMASSYRVKDDQIYVVNRNFGAENMTITVLDNLPNRDGQFLPHHYTVQYWNAKNGQLNRTENFSHEWKRIESFDLPATVTVTEASNSGFAFRTLRLENHKLAAADSP